MAETRAVRLPARFAMRVPLRMRIGMRMRARLRLPIRKRLPGAAVWTMALLAGACSSAEEPAARAPPPGKAAGEETHPEPGDEAPPDEGIEKLDPRVEVDPARAEARFACRFVNPSRLLEVFACHVTGPAHETVVEFAATGPEIYKALLAIGCRNASHWSGTSPGDFMRTRGDRVLVLLRWEHGGDFHEHAAEAMLTDGEAGFPGFVRGFSFSARSPKKIEDIPRAAEITLGGTNRQRAVFSLLVHPTSLPRVLSWMLPPYLDTSVVKDHRALVENGVQATVILRRVRSEEEMVNFARSDAGERGLDDRLPLYDRILPVAREIDRLKRRYEDVVASIRETLAGTEGLAEEEKSARAAKAGILLLEGRWLCAWIEERYLSMQGLEEEFKARWIEKREDIAPEAREDALLRSRDAFSFEPLIARKEVEIAALDLAGARAPGNGPSPGDGGTAGADLSPADRKTLAAALAREIEKLEAEREVKFAEAHGRVSEARYRELDAGDAYMRRLFEEDRMRARIGVKHAGARAGLAGSEARELRARLDGSWEAIREETLGQRAAARTDLKVAELEAECLKASEEIRWLEGDAESDEPERKGKALERLEELKKEKARLEEEIRKAEMEGSRGG